MAQYEHSDWQGSTGGTPWMQRALIGLFRIIPVRLSYALMALVIPFYMLFDRRGFRASYRFFRHRLGRSALHSLLSVYANEFRLGQVVLDRFAIYAGKPFKVEVDDMPLYERLSAGEPGFLQVSSHVGNYEVAGYLLHADYKRIYALVFSGETETVMAQRARMFDRANIEMVPVSADMSHLYTLNNALSDGAVVSMPGDRIFGSQKSFTCDFLGAPARFPAGPFVMAAGRSVAMVAVFVMKEAARRYRIFIRQAGAALDPALPSRARAQAMAAEYAAQLEAVVRRYPTQWYNFYDFWQ